MEVHADGDDGHDGDDADHAGHGHGGVPAVHQEAEDNGDGDEQQGDHGHPGVGLGGDQIHLARLGEGGAEGAGHDGGEGRHHQDQGQVGEDQKQHLGPLAHVGGNDFADGLAVVADGGEQGAEVMDAAKPVGATGGTVFHSRRAGNENKLKFWGISVQQEREVVLILARKDDKLNIMQAIGRKCGINSKAQGIVLSLPVDGTAGMD